MRWQHDETGRICERDTSPGPRWHIIDQPEMTLEGRGAALGAMLAAAIARDSALEEAAAYVERHDVHGGWLVRELAAGIRKMKAIR